MATDLTKLILHTGYDAFKQNSTALTGTKTLSGNTVAGTNIKTFTVTLSSIPDMVDIIFNGPTDPFGTDPRPDAGWFKQGAVWVHTNNAGGGDASKWQLYSTITSATTLTITAVYVQQFTTIEALTATDFSYRVVDYSVF